MKAKRHTQQQSARAKNSLQARQTVQSPVVEAEDLIGVVVQRYLADIQSARARNG
jgi:hypothetical protein